jgi:hypothetical protein
MQKYNIMSNANLHPACITNDARKQARFSYAYYIKSVHEL